MLDVWGHQFRNCDRATRRSVLKAGTLLWGGISLGDLLRGKARAAVEGRSVPDMSVIQIFCGGGPSQLDMYDMKPHAPAEVRGEFQEIPTSVPGLRMSEHLPLQARVMDRMAIVRSVRHNTSSHLPASHYILTGHETAPPANANTHPACGSVVAALRGSNWNGLPTYVAVPRIVAFGLAAYLGAARNPFTTDVDPNDDKFHVRGLKLIQDFTLDRLGDRRQLLTQFDGLRRDLDLHGDMSGMDAFNRQAAELITSDRTARAFDITAEPAEVRERYGRTFIGQNCLLARRLVEAGVSYVTCLSGGGWDTHKDNFKELKDVTLPRYDRAIAALVSDLYERGLDRRVLVMAFGEFGRTPKVNADAGRDHWPGAMCMLLAGGGLNVGQMIGETDSQAAFPISDPCSPADVLATMYLRMGIDPQHAFHDLSSRPIPILPDGKPIRALL
ncbi:MAG: DUF1501 domain-containing protein [Planctomycetaceae bacterium]